MKIKGKENEMKCYISLKKEVWRWGEKRVGEKEMKIINYLIFL